MTNRECPKCGVAHKQYLECPLTPETQDDLIREERNTMRTDSKGPKLWGPGTAYGPMSTDKPSEQASTFLKKRYGITDERLKQARKEIAEDDKPAPAPPFSYECGSADAYENKLAELRRERDAVVAGSDTLVKRIEELRRERDGFEKDWESAEAANFKLREQVARLEMEKEILLAANHKLGIGMRGGIMGDLNLATEVERLEKENAELRETLKHDVDKIEAGYMDQLTAARSELSRILVSRAHEQRKSEAFELERDQALARCKRLESCLTEEKEALSAERDRRLRYGVALEKIVNVRCAWQLSQEIATEALKEEGT